MGNNYFNWGNWEQVTRAEDLWGRPSISWTDYQSNSNTSSWYNTYDYVNIDAILDKLSKEQNPVILDKISLTCLKTLPYFEKVDLNTIIIDFGKSILDLLKSNPYIFQGKYSINTDIQWLKELPKNLQKRRKNQQLSRFYLSFFTHSKKALKSKINIF